MATTNLSKTHPDAYQRLIALSAEADRAAGQAGLDPRLVELVKIRVSQLNGCAFCLRMHTRDAIKHGETADRLAVVAAWWESQYFSDAERSALAVAERVTRIDAEPRHAVVDRALTPEQASAVAWLAVMMNSWNRVAVVSHYPVGPNDAGR